MYDKAGLDPSLRWFGRGSSGVSINVPMLSEVGRYGQSIGAWSSGVVRLEEFAAFACVGSEVGPFCFACMGKGASVKWRLLLALE